MRETHTLSTNTETDYSQNSTYKLQTEREIGTIFIDIQRVRADHKRDIDSFKIISSTKNKIKIQKFGSS